jgi:Immunity protein 52
VIVVADRFYAAAYWSARAEPVEECADRLARFLAALGAAHPLLGTWFEKANTRSASLKREIRPAPGPLRELFIEGRALNDAGRVMDNLGFSAGIWNGNAISVGLTARCGISLQSHAFGNAVVLNLPSAEGDALGIYSPTTARQVMLALAECWQPTWATLTSHALRNAQGPPPRGPVIGWMTYLAAGRSVDAARLPKEASAEAVASGTLITIGSEVAAVTGELVLTVRQALGDALLPIA